MNKKIFKTFVIAFSMVLASACTLDLREDPNAVQLDQIDVNLSLNAIQTSFVGFYSGASNFGEPMVRLTNSGGSRYNNVFTPVGFDGIWSSAYSSFLQDASKLTVKADAEGLTLHSGICRTLSAYVLVTLADYFGEAPYTEALLGAENYNPAADSGEDLYTSAFKLLDDAIVNFNTASSPIPSSPPFSDLYYSGDVAKWKKFANSIKLKMYLNWGNVNAAEAKAGIEAILATADGVITAQNQNFIFRYGTNTTDPDVRHPNYGAYIAGGGTYMSNHLNWMMLHGYDMHKETRAGDPRMRFYWYRQINSNTSNPNEMRCVTEPTPGHYMTVSSGAVILSKGGTPPGINLDPTNVAWSRTYCYPSAVGYWGRDHVDNQGIPPDAFLRTTWGSYPSGGRFDANQGATWPATGSFVAPTMGMRGAGFQPIMMRAFVSFMLAEAVNNLGVVAPKTARTYFSEGIDASFKDVRDWATLGTYGTNAVAASPTESSIATFYSQANYDADVATYKTRALAAYDAQTTADDRLNFIAREYWIAAFENGVETFNMYRRTGKPTGMQPTLDPNPGAFPRSWWFPQTYVALNNKAEQKADLTSKVFWDTKASDLDF